MKGKICLLLISLLLCFTVSGQKKSYKYVNAAELNVIGKVLPTSKPFTRLDTTVYKFNDRTIDCYAEHSTGLAILFRTDSRNISARWFTSMTNAAAKAGISNFTAYMATECAKKFGEGIRVNAIAPGFFITEQNRSLLTNPDGTYTQRGQDVIRQTPFGRMGDPEELCGTIHYLMSDASKFVTGTVAVVDGGFNVFAM